MCQVTVAEVMNDGSLFFFLFPFSFSYQHHHRHRGPKEIRRPASHASNRQEKNKQEENEDSSLRSPLDFFLFSHKKTNCCVHLFFFCFS